MGWPKINQLFRHAPLDAEDMNLVYLTKFEGVVSGAKHDVTLCMAYGIQFSDSSWRRTLTNRRLSEHSERSSIYTLFHTLPNSELGESPSLRLGRLPTILRAAPSRRPCISTLATCNLALQLQARPTRGQHFYSFPEAADAYQQGLFSVHTPLWVRFNGSMETDTPQEEALEMRLDVYGRLERVSAKHKETEDLRNGASSLFVRTTVGRILVNLALPFAEAPLAPR